MFDQRPQPRARATRSLPPLYYLTHFREVLDFVGQHYAHVLTGEHQRFITAFRSLPENAQCLYVRLVNRKQCIFTARRLRYPEIGDTSAALAILHEGGWVGPAEARHFADVLKFLTRAELSEMLNRAFVGLSRSMKKAEYVAFALEHCEPASFVATVDPERVFAQRRADIVQYLLYLYFGKLPDGLAQFTLRDLGLVRTHTFRDRYEPRFAELEEAQDHYYFAQRLKCLEADATIAGPQLTAEYARWPATVYPGAASLRDTLAYQLGRYNESADNPTAAIDVYRRGESAQCTERVVRLMLAAGQRDAARQFLEQCMDEPRNDEEALLASEIYALKFDRKRTSASTDLLRAAETIDLDETSRGAPELAAIKHFRAIGIEAYRVENSLWRMLFGLLFWDELYGADSARVHSPFEFVPTALGDGSFTARHANVIEQRFELLDDTARCKRALLKTSASHFGTANGIFRWHQPTMDALFALLDHAEASALRPILRRFCAAYADARHGYPDLMLIDDNGVRFVEIKAEGDQLRRNQLLRLRQLSEAGFRADVVRVRWTVDPQQTYVVVDVETTGGRGEQHRVTEIGAVKVRGDQVVDRFETLLNPQRSVPARITRLTGISQDMVDDAPSFADIADRFAAFLGDAVFVAHNVGFDYRFIAQEFRRLGRPFRQPRLCTCASMRKLYPGHRSYRLDALCRLYDIPLTSHHRAMCDAEAAAQLLILVNEKRRENLAAA